MEEKRLECTPMFRQNYSTGYFEAGQVECTNDDSFEDIVYIRLQRGDQDTTMFFRPDEASCIAWMLSGVIKQGLLQGYMEHVQTKTSQQEGLPTDQEGQD